MKNFCFVLHTLYNTVGFVVKKNFGSTVILGLFKELQQLVAKSNAFSKTNMLVSHELL